MLGDWDGAKRSLESLDDPMVARLTTLLTEQQRRERERAEAQAVARHELGNAIAIAQANMEALVDGVLEPTPERLTRIRDAMITCGVLLEDLRKQYRTPRENHPRLAVFDLSELVAAQIALVSSIAESKNVVLRYEPRGLREEASTQYRGDPDRVALIVRDVLLGGVRYTPPGGVIDVAWVRSDGEIELTISASCERNGESMGFSLVSKLLDALGGQARVLSETARSTAFMLRLPVSAAVAASG